MFGIKLLIIRLGFYLKYTFLGAKGTRRAGALPHAYQFRVDGMRVFDLLDVVGDSQHCVS